MPTVEVCRLTNYVSANASKSASRFVCAVCGKTYGLAHRAAWRQHVKQKHPQFTKEMEVKRNACSNLRSCPHCPFQTRQNRLLKRHLERKHFPSKKVTRPPGPYKCVNCPATFTAKTNLTKHIRVTCKGKGQPAKATTMSLRRRLPPPTAIIIISDDDDDGEDESPILISPSPQKDHGTLDEDADCKEVQELRELVKVVLTPVTVTLNSSVGGSSTMEEPGDTRNQNDHSSNDTSSASELATNCIFCTSPKNLHEKTEASFISNWGEVEKFLYSTVLSTDFLQSHLLDSTRQSAKDKEGDLFHLQKSHVWFCCHCVDGMQALGTLLRRIDRLQDRLKTVCVGLRTVVTKSMKCLKNKKQDGHGGEVDVNNEGHEIEMTVTDVSTEPGRITPKNPSTLHSLVQRIKAIANGNSDDDDDDQGSLEATPDRCKPSPGVEVGKECPATSSTSETTTTAEVPKTLTSEGVSDKPLPVAPPEMAFTSPKSTGKEDVPPNCNKTAASSDDDSGALASIRTGEVDQIRPHATLTSAVIPDEVALDAESGDERSLLNDAEGCDEEPTYTIVVHQQTTSPPSVLQPEVPPVSLKDEEEEDDDDESLLNDVEEDEDMLEEEDEESSYTMVLSQTTPPPSLPSSLQEDTEEDIQLGSMIDDDDEESTEEEKAAWKVFDRINGIMRTIKVATKTAKLPQQHTPTALEFEEEEEAEIPMMEDGAPVTVMEDSNDSEDTEDTADDVEVDLMSLLATADIVLDANLEISVCNGASVIVVDESNDSEDTDIADKVTDPMSLLLASAGIVLDANLEISVCSEEEGFSSPTNYARHVVVNDHGHTKDSSSSPSPTAQLRSKPKQRHVFRDNYILECTLCPWRCLTEGGLNDHYMKKHNVLVKFTIEDRYKETWP